VVRGEAVVVSGGGEGRFHGREGELAFHGVHDLIGWVGGGSGGGGSGRSARCRHPPHGRGDRCGLRVIIGGIGRNGRGNKDLNDC